MDQKPNSKSLETVKRNGNEILKRVQDDNSAQAQIHVNNNETSHKVTEPKDDTDLADLRTDGANECEQIRVASRLSLLVHKHNRRNTASVKQIQDTSYRPNVLTPSKVAFTLAEVLITLAIIGVVVVLTIPSLVKNYNEKAWSTAQDVFTKRLEVATRQMNTEEKLAGYSSTMDFVNELKNKIKITKICDSSHLTDCFARTITSANNVVYETETDLTQLPKENWGTETVGVQFANGVNALIAYNPNTEQDPYNNQFSATAASMAILYDVSGYKNPNTLGKDINMNGNVKSLGCMISPDLIGGICISQIIAPSAYGALTKAQCEEIADNGYGNDKSYCTSDNDYWAGAVKACGGVSNMPNMNELLELAKYIYEDDDIKSESDDAVEMMTIGLRGLEINTTQMNTDKAAQFIAASPISGDHSAFLIWSNEVGSDSIVYSRYFDYGSTMVNTIGGNERSDTLAVCIDR